MSAESTGKVLRIFTGQARKLALIALGFLVAPALAQEFFPAAPREVLVKFRARALEAIQDIERGEDIEARRKVGGAGTHLFRSRSRDVFTLIRRLAARADVLYVEPNYILHALAEPNAPRFPEVWGLRNTGQTIQGFPGVPGADISATLAWDVSTGSRSNVVGVVDTGLDYNHPDLAANVWSAPRPFSVVIGGQTITCAAGTHGFNAITNSCNPMDDNGHGSHLSGTIGAVGDNATGVVGVNRSASIMGLKFLNSKRSGYLSDVIDAIEFAVQAKAALGSAANIRVLSNSWGGGGYSQALLDEINRANGADMLFVAAAGNFRSNNDAIPSYPASYNAPNVVAVAATDNGDGLARFSNYGAASVHLGAPGVNVLSTVLGSSYAYLSGTSMAAPHVSGAAALVLSICTLNTASLKADLLSNVDAISSLAGRTVTGGRLNVNKAIRNCTGPPVPGFSLSTTPASRTVTQGGSTTYSVTLTASGGFNQNVIFSLSGLPSGATGSFNPPSVTGAGPSTMTISTSAGTPAGSYPVWIAGTGGGRTRTSGVLLVVSPAPDFSPSATPSSRVLPPGATTTYQVTVKPSGGFKSSVAFSVTGLPAGANAGFSPASVTPSGSSAMTVTTTTSTPPGIYPLTIKGASGALVRTTSVSLMISTASNFSISATPSSSSVAAGGSTTYSVTVTPAGGFNGGVVFSVGGVPSGASASFSPTSVTSSGSLTMTVRTSSATPAQTYTLTITGGSGKLARQTTVSLIVSGSGG